jgi:FkbM family methyltransferase
MLDVTDAYGLTFNFPLHDTAVGASLRDHGEFARAELDLMLDVARAAGAGTLVDVGANIGALALPFARNMPSWRVVAVEAHRPLCTVLGANTINNRLFNVDVVNAAAGPRPGRIRFPALALSSHGNFGLLRVGMDGPLEHVRMVALDEVAPPDTRLIKLDVEGFEAEVLKGADRLIRTVRPAWIFEVSHKKEDVARSCISLFLAASYRLFWFYTPFVLPCPLKGSAAFDRGKGDLNVLACTGDPFGWDLPPILHAEADWPTYGEALRYLDRYPQPTAT